MRLARWTQDGRPGDGIVRGDAVFPFPDGRQVADVIVGGIEAALALEISGTRIPLADVVLRTPLDPPAVRDFVAFEEHVEGVVKSVGGGAVVDAEWYDFPTFYFSNPHTLIPTGAIVPVPPTERLDFELEVAAVLGPVPRDGSDLTPAEGAAAIFGFAIFNDWSARDIQAREMKVRLGPAKGKDFASTLGPWIVTADEFTDRWDDDGFLPLGLTVTVNGETIGSDLLSNMGWPWGELVAYASRTSRVVPGDVLGSGTAGNGGCLAELWGRRGAIDPPPLQEGDEVVVTVDGIGEVRNTIGPVREVVPIPPARSRPRTRPAS